VMIIFLVIVFLSSISWTDSVETIQTRVPLTNSFCGQVGPVHWYNANSRLRATGILGVPMGLTSRFPTLYGCTPSEAEDNNTNSSVVTIYAYSSDFNPYLTTSRLYLNGQQLFQNVFSFFSNRYMEFTEFLP